MLSENKLRVIIDTSLIISAVIVLKSPPHQLIKAWLKGSFTLLAAKEQLEEIKDVSQRDKLKRYHLFTERIVELLENIEFTAEIVEHFSTSDLAIHTRDPQDDFLLAFSLAGNADYLVTGDEDLLVLNGNPALRKLKIITAREFLKNTRLLPNPAERLVI